MAGPLEVAEAVPLGYALVARLAADEGVRALAVKGPVLAIQGLREPRTSADIDVLVEPGGLATMRAALERIGWHDPGVVATPHIIPFHSVNHRHPAWPVELDLHHWFPGFLAAPDAVFDVLWRRRVVVSLAHCDCPAPDVVSHAALMALHHLRDASTAWGGAGLDELAGVVGAWDEQRLAELADVAAATGSTQSLDPLLHRVGAPHVARRAALVVPVADWRLRSQAATKEVLPWLVGLARAPWRQRPALLRQALWIDDEHFRPAPGSPPLRPRELRRARWDRLRRGLRALPGASREYLRRDRG